MAYRRYTVANYGAIIKLVTTFVVIFAIVLGFMFLWAKTIERFLLFRKQIKPESLAWFVSLVGIVVSTTASLAMLYLIVNFILNFSASIGESIAKQSQLEPLDKSDCATLVSLISKSQQELSTVENHRNIEENAPLFTINLEYQKGFDMLRKKASEYKNLQVQDSTKVYTEAMANLLDRKADYFKERIDIDLNQTQVQGVFNLLDRMDSATSDRTNIINQIERQCKEA
jgi:hypothetical protein